MKKLLLVFPIILLAAASCNKSQPGQSNNQQSEVKNYDISVSELADYFNAKFDCTAPKISNSIKACFNSNFSSKNVLGVYDNPKYQLTDFTNDGYKDALVTIYYSGSGVMRDFYALTKDPAVTQGGLAVIYEKDGLGLSATNWTDSKVNYFLVGPQTLQGISEKTLTIHWDPQSKKFVEQNQASVTTNPGWKTYTNTQYSFEFQYPSEWSLSQINSGSGYNPSKPYILLWAGSTSDAPCQDLGCPPKSGDRDVLTKGNTYEGGYYPFYKILRVRGNKWVSIQLTDVNQKCLTNTDCEQYVKSIPFEQKLKLKNPNNQTYNNFIDLISTFKFTN